MGKYIRNTQTVVSIIWSIIILVIVILVIYFTWKKHNKDKQHNRLKVAIKSEKYNSIDEETTMIQYPEYDLKKNMHPKYVIQSDNKKEDVDLFGYKDLLDNVQNDEFIRGYVESLRKALKDKRKIYKNLMEKSVHAYNVEKAKEVNENNSLVLPILKAEYIEFPIILSAINNRLKRLNTTNMRDEFEKMLWHKKYGLETIIGREDIKNFIAEEVFAFYRDPKPSYTTIRNFSVIGGTGIGKNKIGEAMAYAYCKSGILARNKFTIMNAHDLVSQFVSGTAHLTHSRLVAHLEGMILIDEAYQLTTPNMYGTADHGKEAITAIVGFITKYTGLSRIGALGYLEPMEKQFYGANEGMKRRFPNKIILKEYDTEQLTKILIRLISESSDIYLSDSEANAIYGMMSSSTHNNPNIFPTQAGDMHNLASTICQTVSTIRNKRWIDGDSKNNIHIILIGFNRYLSNIHQPILDLN